MHCICCASSHNWLRNHTAGAFTQPREMEMTCSPCKQRFFMSLPRVTRLFAATQSTLLPRFVLFTFLRRQDAAGKYSSLTDAICVLLLVSPKDYLPLSLSRTTPLPKPYSWEPRQPTSFFPWVIKWSSQGSPRSSHTPTPSCTSEDYTSASSCHTPAGNPPLPTTTTLWEGSINCQV